MQGADLFSPYETGLRELLRRIDRDDPRYADVLVYQQRLIENVAKARRYPDHPALQADRAKVIDQLNSLARAALAIPFNEFGGLSALGPSGSPRAPFMVEDLLSSTSAISW